MDNDEKQSGEELESFSGVKFRGASEYSDIAFGSDKEQDGAEVIIQNPIGDVSQELKNRKKQEREIPRLRENSHKRAIIALCAASCAVLVLLIVFLSGVRYKKITLDNGETVRFFGKCTLSGDPVSGRIKCSDGLYVSFDSDSAYVSYPNGNIYRGEIDVSLSNGALEILENGNGTYRYTNGDRYVGSFSDGKKTSGTYYYADGSTCSGDFSGTGIFVYTYANGDVYTGKLENGKKNGAGVYVFSSGGSFCGEFSQDEMTGGTYTFSNGDVYTGTFSDGMKNGDGTYIYADGSKYSGGFAFDKMSGEGIFSYPNGDVYTGMFMAGEKNGNGIYAFANGDSYTGYFANGQAFGQVMYKDSDGTIRYGVIKDGMLVENG